MLGVKSRQLAKPVLLGQGTFSKVYRITDAYTGKLLACKISSNKEMAEREAFFLENVRHPAFPQYYGCLEKEKDYCILMEYICGSSLRKYVDKRGKVKEKQAVRIAVEIADALKFLHEQPNPMVFRDLKPENIMIQADGRVRLVDLGCVCYLEGNAVKKGLRQESQIVTHVGTPGYAAPEQFGVNGKAGRESDVYALGKVLEYMLTGRDGGRSRKAIKGISKRTRKTIELATHMGQQERIPDMRMLLELLQKRVRVKEHFYYEKDICKI